MDTAHATEQLESAGQPIAPRHFIGTAGYPN
jgi:hypothetical protein